MPNMKELEKKLSGEPVPAEETADLKKGMQEENKKMEEENEEDKKKEEETKENGEEEEECDGNPDEEKPSGGLKSCLTCGLAK